MITVSYHKAAVDQAKKLKQGIWYVQSCNFINRNSQMGKKIRNLLLFVRNKMGHICTFFPFNNKALSILPLAMSTYPDRKSGVMCTRPDNEVLHEIPMLSCLLCNTISAWMKQNREMGPGAHALIKTPPKTIRCPNIWKWWEYLTSLSSY